MADQFATRDKFVLAIFPEGTRRLVPKWKTGFWYIAKQAQVPVQLIAVDYDKHATVFGPVMMLSDDKEQDIKRMRWRYNRYRCRYPANNRQRHDDNGYMVALSQ